MDPKKYRGPTAVLFEQVIAHRASDGSCVDVESLLRTGLPLLRYVPPADEDSQTGDATESDAFEAIIDGDGRLRVRHLDGAQGSPRIGPSGVQALVDFLEQHFKLRPSLNRRDP